MHKLWKAVFDLMKIYWFCWRSSQVTSSWCPSAFMLPPASRHRPMARATLVAGRGWGRTACVCAYCQTYEIVGNKTIRNDKIIESEPKCAKRTRKVCSNQCHHLMIEWRYFENKHSRHVSVLVCWCPCVHVERFIDRDTTEYPMLLERFGMQIKSHQENSFDVSEGMVAYVCRCVLLHVYVCVLTERWQQQVHQTILHCSVRRQCLWLSQLTSHTLPASSSSLNVITAQRYLSLGRRIDNIPWCGFATRHGTTVNPIRLPRMPPMTNSITDHNFLIGLMVMVDSMGCIVFGWTASNPAILALI